MKNLLFIYIIFASCFFYSFGVITWKDFMKKAKEKTHNLSEKLKPFFLERYPFNNVSEKCTRSLIRYADGLKNWEPWAVNMFDLTGKPPSSILKGTNTDFGSFDDCIEIEVKRNEESDSFKGHFCMLHMQSPLIAPMNFRADNGISYIKKYGIPPDWIADKMKLDGLLREFGLYLGICLPSTCSEKDIIEVVTSYTKSAELKISLTDCQIKEPRKWSLSAKLSLFVILCLLASCSIGTYLDASDKKSKNNNVKHEDKKRKMLKAFSVSQNWEDLNENNENKNALSLLPGMKFWLCIGITYGHTFLYETYWKLKTFTNFYNVMEVMSPITILVENATAQVEYYFCMSGFLLTYTFWKKLEKSGGNINIKEIIKQKIFRLAPVHIFLVLLLFVLPMTLNGPIWNSTWNDELRKCYDYGWSNLLFLQNFQRYENICWIHTWYIAASLQIQILSIVLLIVIYKHPKIGISLGVLINIGCFWREYYTSLSNKYLLLSLKSTRDLQVAKDYMTDIYFKPYSHVASHTIGMILGWFVMKGYRVPKKYHIPLWILYFPSLVLINYSIKYPTDNITLCAIHNTFRNTVQSLIFSWLLYTCTTGTAGYVGYFFSLSFYTTFDKISYCVYMLHPVIIVFFNAVMRERHYMSKVQHTIESFAIILASVIFATVGHLLVEKPINKIYDIWVTKESAPATRDPEKLKENGIKNGLVKKDL